MAKRRQPNPMQPHFSTDTMHTQPTQYGDGGHIMTSSWMCSYPGEKPAESPHIWETPLPVPKANQFEGEYTLPANMRHAHDKADQQAQLVAETALSESIQPTSHMLTSTMSDGEYTAPIIMHADDQQQTAVPPQPMPEYTLPIKKEMRASSPANNTEASPTEDDYLLPSTGRPEPVGSNDVPAFEGSSLKNANYRPDSVMVDSVVEDAQEYINVKDDSTHDALLQ